MRRARKGALALMLAGLALVQGVLAAETLVLGLQESGTVQWEIAAIKALGLDAAHGVDLEIRPLADSRAGQIALQAGALDVILSDFVFVSLQRSRGAAIAMVPHSLAVGGLMVPPGSAIAELDDLKGRTIGIAGGPVDKSWVILQAYYAHDTGRDLAQDAQARFGAPPLVNELLASGGVDAGLNFWQWNARAEAAGMVEWLSVADMLADLGIATPPPLLGWTFTERTARTKKDALVHFLDASFAAKAALARDDGLWESLKPVMGAEADPALFVALREGYRAGIVAHPDPAMEAAAAQVFGLLAQYGGTALVGDSNVLAPGTFWGGYGK